MGLEPGPTMQMAKDQVGAGIRLVIVAGKPNICPNSESGLRSGTNPSVSSVIHRFRERRARKFSSSRGRNKPPRKTKKVNKVKRITPEAAVDYLMDDIEKTSSTLLELHKDKLVALYNRLGELLAWNK